MERSPLGQLGKLPYEIRLEIYEKLFTIKKSPLKILRCSRAIYGEITDRLYDTLDIHLTPVFNDPWVEIHCKRLRLRWTIPNHSYFVQYRFSRAPYYKMNLVVHIYAPDPRDPGQIALLWQKAQHLVETLEDATIASIVIRLRKHKSHDWQEEGHVVESIPYPNNSRPDYHIVFLPFCRLSNVGSFRVFPDTRRMDRVADWGLINYGRDFILNNGYQNYNDGPLSQDRQYRDIVREFDNIDALIRDTNFFLETRLDTLHGHTAAMLRLDRIAHWPLGARIDNHRIMRSLLDIRQHPGLVKLHDPGLKSHSRRMWAFRNMYHLSSSVLDKDSWEEWRSCYPEGLGPHDKDSIDGQTDTIRRTPWCYNTWDSTLENQEYETSLENYLQRNCGGSSGCRRPGFEQEWCTDCRRIGYRTGCDQECEDIDDPYNGEYSDYWTIIARDFSDPNMW